MPDSVEDAELARRFLDATATQQPRAPLYAALAAGVANDPDLYGLLRHAPPTQRLPVLLFAATHFTLLAEPEHELAAWYPNLTEDHRDPDDSGLVPTFKRFITERMSTVVRLLATRSVQTNEIGRCLLLLPAMAAVGNEMGSLGHLDVGTSAGLNLLLDRYHYRYEAEHGGTPTLVSPAASEETASTPSLGAEIVLAASTRGALALPDRMPTIAARLGIDANPIDVTTPDDARWLEACVWPDQRDRFLRLRAAIELARRNPPPVEAGDAVEALAAAIERVGSEAHPVITNSWVLNYLDLDQREAYVAELERVGASRDLSWVFAESPVMTPGLPWQPDALQDPMTVVGLARWRDGVRTVEQLATCHPHGFWMHARR